MTLEKLKALLESGSITQEEFDEMVAKLMSEPDTTQNDPQPDPQPKDDFDYDKIERLVQAKVDKATAKFGKEKAELKKQLDKLRAEKLTDEELKQLELGEKEREIAEREKAIRDKENRLYAVKVIKEAGLDDGSDTALNIVEFVMGNDETEINEKVKAFGSLLKKLVDVEVEKKFKENGRQPNGAGSSEHANNPYKKETFNLTEQMKLEMSNPELANQLKALAGVK